jgi:hypothetical protein
MRKLTTLLLSCLIFFQAANVSLVHAADFRTGEEVVIPEGAANIQDVYLFGNTIKVNAPITNDAVVAGGDIDISNGVTGSVMVAGGNIILRGPIGNTVRAAGGNIKIDSPITRDLVVTGGSITVTKNASIGGDVFFGGGNFILDGPVNGKVIINGGNVTLNSTITGNVEGTVEKLTLGPNAKIAGTLSYKAEQQASVANGATVLGKTTFTPTADQEMHDQTAKEFITAVSLYKLVADVIISILIIYFFGRPLLIILKKMKEKTVESGAVGFAFVLLFPIAALLMLILIWLGMGAWLAYGFALLVSLFIAKIFLGWFVMKWWEKRKNKDYALDWKAGVLGPIALFILLLIPILGWLAGAVLFLVATGALLTETVQLLSKQKLATKIATKKD